MTDQHEAKKPRLDEDGGSSGTRAAGQDEQVFVGSIDQGTTSSRFLVFNTDGEPVVSHQIEFENLYPQSG